MNAEVLLDGFLELAGGSEAYFVSGSFSSHDCGTTASQTTTSILPLMPLGNWPTTRQWEYLEFIMKYIGRFGRSREVIVDRA